MLVTRCGTLSWLVQITVAPTATVNVFGEKLKLPMITSVFVALTGADCLVSGSLPRIVFSRARATNKTNARVQKAEPSRNGGRRRQSAKSEAPAIKEIPLTLAFEALGSQLFGTYYLM